MARPSRDSLEKALRQLVDAFCLRVEERVPGKCVCVEWPNVVNSVVVFEREAVRAIEYLEQSDDHA